MNKLIILILIALVVISLLCYKHFFIKEYMNNYKDNPTHILLKNKKNNNNITNTIKKTVKLLLLLLLIKPTSLILRIVFLFSKKTKIFLNTQH